jgi:hypothetical protein
MIVRSIIIKKKKYNDEKSVNNYIVCGRGRRYYVCFFSELIDDIVYLVSRPKNIIKLRNISDIARAKRCINKKQRMNFIVYSNHYLNFNCSCYSTTNIVYNSLSGKHVSNSSSDSIESLRHCWTVARFTWTIRKAFERFKLGYLQTQSPYLLNVASSHKLYVCFNKFPFENRFLHT